MAQLIHDATKVLKVLTALITGITAEAPAGATALAVGGQTYLMPALLLKLTGYQTPFTTVATLQKQLAAAIEARDAIASDALTFITQTQTSVKSALGRTSKSNADYGITPDKVRTPLTPEQLVLRAQRAAATRKARGTLGSKQKKAIKGQVPGAK